MRAARGFSFVALALALAAPGISSCRRDHRFETVCQLIRRDAVQLDEQGAVAVVDIELEYDACPGDQFHVVRGGAAFARCMERYAVGQLLPVRMRQWWDTRGFYTWDVYRVGACERPIELESEGSFERSQECHDTRSHGHENGFDCSRRPFRKLLAVCPWMARH